MSLQVHIPQQPFNFIVTQYNFKLLLPKSQNFCPMELISFVSLVNVQKKFINSQVLK